jgi:hypothetical protein
VPVRRITVFLLLVALIGGMVAPWTPGIVATARAQTTSVSGLPLSTQPPQSLAVAVSMDTHRESGLFLVVDNGSVTPPDFSMPPASTALPSPSQVQAAKPAGNKSAGTYPDPTYRVVRMGIYADVGYCNAYPQWNLQLLYLVQQLNAILNGQISGMAMVVAGPTCISGSDQWGNDPGTFMSYFTSWCGTDTGCKNADYAQLGTTHTWYDSNGHLILGAADVEPGKLSWIKMDTGTWQQRTISSAHELGHTLWGDHNYADSWSDWNCWYEGGTDHTIMYEGYSGDCSMKSWYSDTNRKAILSQSRQYAGYTLPYVSQSTTSSDGFYVTQWWARYLAVTSLNTKVDVHFYFVNPTSSGVTISNIFVGCRNGPGQNTNCDFGYTGSVYIASGSSYEFSVIGKVLGVTGTWQLWPAYYYNGHYGPYQWQMAQVPVVNAVKGTYLGPDTSAQGVQLHAFSVLAPSSTVHVGDTLTVEFYYFNTLSGFMNFDPYGILVGARDPSGNNRDFGQTVLGLWGSSSTSIGIGETTTLVASITVNAAGTWVFWPAYYLNGWGPYQWHAISVSVSS